MEYLKISLSRHTTLSIWMSEDRQTVEKILMVKEEIIPLLDKNVLTKHQISLTLEEYRLLNISLPSIENLTDAFSQQPNRQSYSF